MLADADDNADRAPATLPAVLIPATEDDAPADELSSVMSAMMDDDDDDGSCVGCCYFLVGGACCVCVFGSFGVVLLVRCLPGRDRGFFGSCWLLGLAAGRLNFRIVVACLWWWRQRSFFYLFSKYVHVCH